MITARLNFAIPFALFLVCRMASAETQTVAVGGTTISLPSPEGCFRYDGKSAKVDDFEQRFVPATNRLLATFGSEETVAEVLMDHLPESERHFAAECNRSLESLDVTQASF